MSKNTGETIGVTDVYNWIRGNPNKIDDMKVQRVQQITRREASLKRMEPFEKLCPYEMAKYYSNNIAFGLEQQKELLNSPLISFYDVSKKHLDITDKIYSNLENTLPKLDDIRKPNCNCILNIIDFELSLHAQSTK
jgi:hypothetical protein